MTDYGEALTGVAGRKCEGCTTMAPYDDQPRFRTNCPSCHGTGHLPLEPGSVRLLLETAQAATAAAYRNCKDTPAVTNEDIWDLFSATDALETALAAFTVTKEEEL